MNFGPKVTLTFYNKGQKSKLSIRYPLRAWLSRKYTDDELLGERVVSLLGHHIVTEETLSLYFRTPLNFQRISVGPCDAMSVRVSWLF